MKRSISILVVTLISVLVLVNCGGGPSTPQDIVKESFRMMEKNDQAGIKDLLSTQVKALLDDKKLEEGLNNRYNEIKAKGGIAEIEFLKEEIDEDEANFKVKLVYGDGTSKDEKVKLVKEEGEWKLGISK